MIKYQTSRQPDKGLSDSPVYFNEQNSDIVEYTLTNHKSTNLNREPIASLATATPVSIPQATTHIFFKATPYLPEKSLTKINH